MKFHTVKDFALKPNDFVARASPWTAGVFTLLFGAMILAMAVFQFPHIAGVRWAVMTFLALIGWAAASQFRAALGPQNWLLACDGGRVAVKFRSYLNAHFPPEDEVIVTLERGEIDWLQATRESFLVVTAKNRRRQTNHLLDIGLKDSVDTRELAERLKLERSIPPQGGWVKTRSKDNPLHLIADGRVLRLTWYGQGTRVRPGLDATLQRLGKLAPVRAAQQTDADFTTPPASREEAETRIVALVERGATIAAIKLARQTYGLSLSDAKKFVESLRNA